MFSPSQLKNRREALKISQSELAKKLGISRASYFNWEIGKTKPNRSNLEKLSQLLEVPESYFESEFEIVELYLQLNEENQQHIVQKTQEVLELQAALEQKQEEPVPLYEYHVYERLSAGQGEYAMNDYHYDTVYFDEAIDHDIASWIYGDSMEPKYLNGSIALIKETGFDYDGAIYAVVWDGQTYLKKVYREENGLRLVSLNKKYADKLAPYDEEPRVVGKVVGNFMPLVG